MHGLRADCGIPCGGISREDTLHVVVVAISHWQRLVRRYVPLLATAIVAATGGIYAGLWYPIGISVMTLAVGLIFLRDTKGVDITTSSGVSIQKA